MLPTQDCNIRYFSCRDTKLKKPYTFEESIFAGLAEDGGMIMPQPYPQLNKQTLQTWASLSYPQLCVMILQLFTQQELQQQELKQVVENAFQNFGGDKNILIMKKIYDSPEIYTTELWHGPTLAFKDLGMQILTKFLSFFLQKKNQNSQQKHVLNLLVGTSGDTGSAAIHAVAGLPYIGVTVLFPKGRGVSIQQELQMTTVIDPFVHVIGVDGSSDDLDVPIDNILADYQFKMKNSIGSVNSINICRLLVQVIHYFWSYLQICPNVDEEIGFSIPTGAAGHITAGMIAIKMGLPVTNLHAAVNSNNNLDRIIKTGTSKLNDENIKQVFNTYSPSMDIQIQYNFERMLHLTEVLSGEQISLLMNEYKSKQEISIPQNIQDLLKNTYKINSSSSSDEETLQTINQIYSDKNYVLDPHTAVGVHAALTQTSLFKSQKIICMACAHPSKFKNTIDKAINKQNQEPWYWLSEQDKNHTNVKKLFDIEQKQGKFTPYNKDMDWNQNLRTDLEKMYASLMNK